MAERRAPDAGVAGDAVALPAGAPRLSGVSSYRARALDAGWELVGTPPGAAADPRALDAQAPAWRPALVPGTVAATLRRDGELRLDAPPDFDANDWWYRCRFEGARPQRASRTVLRFGGLATLADVWLNGTHLLSSDDMFVAHDVDVSDALHDGVNELHVRFAAVRTALETRRPRPRWRTRLVEHQQLRWFRTTLLGRIPAWTPPVRPVGPWLPVLLEERRAVEIVAGDVLTTLDADGPVAHAALAIRALGGDVRTAELHVGDDHVALSPVARADGTVLLRGTLRCPRARAWWPHTHGEQPRYAAHVVIDAGGERVRLDLGQVAFRRIELRTGNGAFTVSVNGVEIFCRGACWTSADPVALLPAEGRLRRSLELARDGGMNMLRVVGTMIYESDAFYDACDELGILVWQDFMFANMDYPADDPTLAAAIAAEAAQAVARLRRHPSLGLWCGNSEIEQQVAMLGLPREQWSQRLFAETLPALCAAGGSDAPYWSSSPSGGVLPFHVDEGDGHYYGVGAYLRPLDDVRRAGVRFASETLGFSNVPARRTVEELLPGGEGPGHHPHWKARVPRDFGAGWDFEDVRDHYLARLFGVEPMRVRYADAERWLALGRVVTGELMHATVGEWRSSRSACRGALVWTFQDLWHGAGWGVIDAALRPKAAYYYLRRAMRPIAVFVSDEGVNGLRAHVVNDGGAALHGELRVRLVRDGRVVVGEGRAAVTVGARGATEVAVDALLEGFRDPGYAYRFGPPGHDLVVVTLEQGGAAMAEAFHFPLGLPAERSTDSPVTAAADWDDDGSVMLTVSAERFAQSVSIEASGFVPDDDFFHVAPGDARVVRLRAEGAPRECMVSVQALNAHAAARATAARREAGRPGGAGLPAPAAAGTAGAAR